MRAPYLIADLGSCWRTSADLATAKAALLRWISTINPDVITYLKLQVWDVDRLIDTTQYRPEQVATLRYYQLPHAWLPDIVAACRAIGITPMATPLDTMSLVACAAAGIAHWKVASGDITYTLLADALAATGQPIWLSTGNATLAEVSGALARLRQQTKAPLTVLHCISQYPTPPDACGWARMGELLQLATIYQSVKVGWSSHVAWPHTMATNIIAAMLGATCIELHTRIDGAATTLPTAPDYGHSLTATTIVAVHGQLGDALAAVGAQPAQSAHERTWARRGIDGLRPDRDPDHPNIPHTIGCDAESWSSMEQWQALHPSLMDITWFSGADVILRRP